MAEARKKFFIIGVQRSGTTLLRLMLNAHSQITVPREAFFLMPLLKKKYLNKFISKKTLEGFNDCLVKASDVDSTCLKGSFIEGNYYKVIPPILQQKEYQ